MCPFMAYLQLLNNCSHTGDSMEYRKLNPGLVWDLQSCFYEIMTLILKKKKKRKKREKESPNGRTECVLQSFSYQNVLRFLHPLTLQCTTTSIMTLSATASQSQCLSDWEKNKNNDTLFATNHFCSCKPIYGVGKKRQINGEMGFERLCLLGNCIGR